MPGRAPRWRHTHVITLAALAATVLADRRNHRSPRRPPSLPPPSQPPSPPPPGGSLRRPPAWPRPRHSPPANCPDAVRQPVWHTSYLWIRSTSHTVSPATRPGHTEHSSQGPIPTRVLTPSPQAGQRAARGWTRRRRHKVDHAVLPLVRIAARARAARIDQPALGRMMGRAGRFGGR